MVRNFSLLLTNNESRCSCSSLDFSSSMRGMYTAQHTKKSFASFVPVYCMISLREVSSQRAS